MNNNVVKVAVGLRLGVSLCQPHHCHQCRTEVDHLGLHGLSYRMSQGRHSQHTVINKLIRRPLASAKIPSHLEPSGTSCVDGKRPDGATVMPCKCGRVLTRDIYATCHDTYALHICPLLLGSLVQLQTKQSSQRQKSMPTSVLSTTLCPSLLRPGGCLDLRHCPCWKTLADKSQQRQESHGPSSSSSK